MASRLLDLLSDQESKPAIRARQYAYWKCFVETFLSEDSGDLNCFYSTCVFDI